jgi:calcium/calmodulin-dependent protein kinase I
MHRDLKPENVIFRDSKEGIDIGVVDLGFATYESDYKKLFIRCGTPGYVAPEVLKDRSYDCRVDIYSIGIILYIMWIN